MSTRPSRPSGPDRRGIGLALAAGALFVAALIGLAHATGRPAGANAGPARHHRTSLAPARAAPADPTTAPLKTAESMLATLGAQERAVAYARVPRVAVFTTPGAPAPWESLANPNSLGAPLVFLVASARGNWLQVMLPQRPNGATGWIPASQVTLYSDNYSVRVALGIHQLSLYQAGRLLETYQVAVGNAASPTPTGHFYVTELVSSANPNGAYGPYAFGLSGFSNTYSEFDGGPGQIAIHGTDEPWVIGTSASHGCIRLNNVSLEALVKVLPVGSPVDITP